jgi:hypothetical protein
MSEIDLPLKDGPHPTIGIPWSPEGYLDVTLGEGPCRTAKLKGDATLHP